MANVSDVMQMLLVRPFASIFKKSTKSPCALLQKR
jgi:hypothetical protein